MHRFDLKDLSIQEMEDLISSLGEKPYRAKQVSYRGRRCEKMGQGSRVKREQTPHPSLSPEGRGLR
jgi:hypothetical protein